MARTRTKSPIGDWKYLKTVQAEPCEPDPGFDTSAISLAVSDATVKVVLSSYQQTHDAMLAVYVLASVGLAYAAKQLIYRWTHRIRRHGQRLRKPPGTLPFFGNGLKFLLLDRQSLFDWFSEIHNDVFGFETYEISVPTLPPGIVISDPEVLDLVMKREGKEGFGKGPFFEERSWHLFGRYGIINASGQLWKTQRKAGNKFFAGSHLQVLVDEVFPKYWERARQELDEAAETGKVVDMEELYLEFTTRVMGRVAFGMDLSNSHPFSAAFDYASDLTGLRFQNPLWKLNYYLFGHKFRSAVSIVKSFGNEIVRLAVCRREQKTDDAPTSPDLSLGEGGDLVDMLLDAVPEPHVVADSAINFLSAGRDTTANSMTWMLHLLLEQPDLMRYITSEVPPAGTVHTYSSLSTTATPRSHAIFLETLRLYPPVPFELKQTLKPDGVTLPDGTVLPHDSIVVWCPYAFGRSKKIWGDDAYDFRPDRWLEKSPLTDDGSESDVRLKVRSAAEYPVFNGGARSCLGKRMAEVMGLWVLAESLRNWEFEEVEKVGRRRSRNSLTLPMDGGLKVRVKKRIGDIGS
ncbi:Cytochrome P450 [Drechslerella dactyloides]|uniref:Cytochrome P450 n=1 Tax=Drechslerella dactyloides TaxID=74499 RepID=A0AAD6IVY2_DREDA|nr:Cytochrome P450 [Drechslerella dactyloides]